MRCECVDPDTNEPSPTCLLCEPNGQRYIEQTIALGIDGAPAKALVSRTQTEYEDAEFGRVAIGSMQVSVIPDEIGLARGDRLALLDREFAEIKRQAVTRGPGDEDALVHPLCAGIRLVLQGETYFRPDVDFASGDSGVLWLSGVQNGLEAERPVDGTRYGVEYAIYPRFTVFEKPATLHGTGADGPLPREWVLTPLPPEQGK